MTLGSRLLINHLSYTIPNTTVQFNDLNCAFEKRRYGIVGDNGVGKTTLLKLIMGVFKPLAGDILCNGTITYCSQQFEPLL